MGRTAERRVWEALREQLPDDAALLHSVAMISEAAEYEADLVVAWPGVGVAVVEVKGGHVSRRDGQWYQSSGGDIRVMKDPAVQAQDCKHVLHRLLLLRGSEAAAARSVHLVAFPVHGYRSGLVVRRMPARHDPGQERHGRRGSPESRLLPG